MTVALILAGLGVGLPLVWAALDLWVLGGIDRGEP